MKERTVRVPILVSVQDTIDAEQPAAHYSCDWLRDPLALGLQIFPLKTYEILRSLNHGEHSSSRVE